MKTQRGLFFLKWFGIGVFLSLGFFVSILAAQEGESETLKNFPNSKRQSKYILERFRANYVYVGSPRIYILMNPSLVIFNGEAISVNVLHSYNQKRLKHSNISLEDPRSSEIADIYQEGLVVPLSRDEWKEVAKGFFSPFRKVGVRFPSKNDRRFIPPKHPLLSNLLKFAPAFNVISSEVKGYQNSADIVIEVTARKWHPFDNEIVDREASRDTSRGRYQISASVFDMECPGAILQTMSSDEVFGYLSNVSSIHQKREPSLSEMANQVAISLLSSLKLDLKGFEY